MTTLPTYDAEQLEALLDVLPGADAVELKLTVPGADHRRGLDRLGIDPLAARIRQVAFLDTVGLQLTDAGVVLRARRTQHKAGDLTVKLRPMLPADVPAHLRDADGFKVEVDASPSGFTCSCSLTAQVPDPKARSLLAGGTAAAQVLTRTQRQLVEDRLPAGVGLADLQVLGPLTLLRAKVAPPDFGHRLVAELWFLPDGARILELSMKAPPATAFQVAAEAKVFLAGRGFDLGAPQETKTRTALAALVAALDEEM